jgi:hypothetical protein
MRSVDIKTIWAGRAWVHQKYLNEAKRRGEGIELVYKKKGVLEVMVIPPERVKPEFWEKSKIPHRDKFSKEEYYLYGVVWVPVDKSHLQQKLL